MIVREDEVPTTLDLSSVDVVVAGVGRDGFALNKLPRVPPGAGVVELVPLPNRPPVVVIPVPVAPPNKLPPRPVLDGCDPPCCCGCCCCCC